MDALHALCRHEGIIPALESSHALAQAMKTAKGKPSQNIIIVNLSGRGDKDLETVLSLTQNHNNEQTMERIKEKFIELKEKKEKALVGFLTG